MTNSPDIKEEVIKILGDAQVTVFRRDTPYSTSESKKWSAAVSAEAINSIIDLIHSQHQQACREFAEKVKKQIAKNYEDEIGEDASISEKQIDTLLAQMDAHGMVKTVGYNEGYNTALEDMAREVKEKMRTSKGTAWSASTEWVPTGIITHKDLESVVQRLKKGKNE